MPKIGRFFRGLDGGNRFSGIKTDSAPWTPEDTKILEEVLAGVVVVALLLFMIVPPILRSSARKYVLENKGALAAKLAESEKTAKNSDVKVETRAKLTKLKADFSPIDRLSEQDEHVKWSEIREQLDSMHYPLEQINAAMMQEIAFAKKAREEGPKLMQQLPGMLEAAEKKLAEGKTSEKATRYLEEARAKYTQAQQQQQSGMTMTDWVILYILLNDSQSSCARAESTHEYANTSHSSYSSSTSSSSSDSSTSLGFGDSGGFGGGGGFDSGGGGSSGSW